jgi:hypothetical protein
MQQTLLSFMGKKEIYPTIFYLDNSNNDYNVYLNNTIPKKSIKIGKIKWNYSKNNLHIYLNNTYYDIYNFQKNYTTQNISLLKSQLQKSIRQQLIDLSLNIAYQFINLDLSEFLRRILIITLEDVLLNKYFPVITWMMVAYSTKNWKPSINDINWLLNYTKYLCTINYREKYDKLDITTVIPKFKVDLFNTLIFSLELRKSYGGMICDLKMINWFINTWFNRFTNNINIDILNNNIIIEDLLNIIENKELIKPTTMLLEGVDFHNYPQLLQKIKNVYMTYELEDIKKAIWEYSSKFNTRYYLNTENKETPNDLDDKYYKIWKNIKDSKKKYSQIYLELNTL